MAKRSIDGQPPLPGDFGEPGTRPFTPPEFHEFDLDIRFKPKDFDEDYTPITGCVCMGATEIDTVGGQTCVKLCVVTRLKICLSNVRCISAGGKTCLPCWTLATYRKVTCNTCHTCYTCNGCPPAGTNSAECG